MGFSGCSLAIAEQHNIFARHIMKLVNLRLEFLKNLRLCALRPKHQLWKCVFVRAFREHILCVESDGGVVPFA